MSKEAYERHARIIFDNYKEFMHVNFSVSLLCKCTIGSQVILTGKQIWSIWSEVNNEMTNNYIVEWLFFTKGGKVPSGLQIDDVLLNFRKHLFDLNYNQYKPTFVQSLDTSTSEGIAGQNH